MYKRQQETGIKKQRHEIKLEPYDFDKIAGTLGIELIQPYLEEDIKFYMEKFGDGYLGEVYICLLYTSDDVPPASVDK